MYQPAADGKHQRRQWQGQPSSGWVRCVGDHAGPGDARSNSNPKLVIQSIDDGSGRDEEIMASSDDGGGERTVDRGAPATNNRGGTR